MTKPRKMKRTRPTSDCRAFLDDTAHAREAVAESLAEEFLASATSGEESAFADRDENAVEENGGPYLTEVIPRELLDEE